MIRLPEKVQAFIDAMRKPGYEVYAVGGSVRNLLLGNDAGDWDFTTNATPDQIIALYPDSFYDNQFGTVGVKIYKKQIKTQISNLKAIDDDSHERQIKTQNSNLKAIDDEFHEEIAPEIEEIYEITTYRSEKNYTDSRHPDEVTWGTSLTEDLARRDFTINAIAFDGTTIIDPYDGQDDLEKQLIRAVGDPEQRFIEDALRMMRAIRIASQLGFTIDPATFDAIKKQSGLISRISWERIHDELLKIMASPYPADGVLLLRNTGLLSYILPELDICFGVEQKSIKRHHIYDVGTHAVMALKHCPSTDPIVRFATLLHDIGKPKTFHQDKTGLITFYNHEVAGANIARHLCHRLRFSNKDLDKIITLIRWHQFSVDERQTDSAIRRIIRRVTKEYLDDMLALRIGDRLGGGALETSWRLELFKKRLVEVQLQPFSIADLKVTGHDVMEVYDIKPGRQIGEVLGTLFALVENNELPNEREALLNKMRELRITPPTTGQEN